MEFFCVMSFSVFLGALIALRALRHYVPPEILRRHVISLSIVFSYLVAVIGVMVVASSDWRFWIALIGLAGLDVLSRAGCVSPDNRKQERTGEGEGGGTSLKSK